MLAELEETYGKKKKKKMKGQDEEDILLDKMEALVGDRYVSYLHPVDFTLSFYDVPIQFHHHHSGTDDSYEPAIGTEQKKSKKLSKKKQKEKEHNAFEGFEGSEDDDEDMSMGEDMMKEMQEDDAAMREMYGIGNFDGDDDFGALKGEDEVDEELKEQEDEKLQRAVGGGDDYSSDEEQMEAEDDEDEDEELAPVDGQTPFQQRQQKLLKKIQRIENERLEQAHWTMTGETMASMRPENALLEEHLEFDHTQNAKAVVTAEVTKSFEERLKHRVQVWPLATLTRHPPPPPTHTPHTSPPLTHRRTCSTTS